MKSSSTQPHALPDHHSDLPRVRARSLDIGYAGESIVAGVNFQLEAGQSLALIGMNGSGKSTLLKTLVGLLSPLGGEIEVLGGRPGTAPRQIAYLSQFHGTEFILPLRAVDVVQMGRFPERGLLGRMTPEDDRLVHEAMGRMGIAALADAPLRTMSGGQQQRTYLAQVLAHRADLIILDEPTAGLDAAGKDAYIHAMKAELARGATLITATHDIQEASTCDLVLLLARRVVGLGPPGEVLTSGALLETFGIAFKPQDQLASVAAVVQEHGHDHSHAGHRH
ncbi:MAG: metal ABC transporter ATP-binding protein [Acidobacteriota bacterium]